MAGASVAARKSAPSLRLPPRRPRRPRSPTAGTGCSPLWRKEAIRSDNGGRAARDDRPRREAGSDRPRRDDKRRRDHDEDDGTVGFGDDMPAFMKIAAKV